MIMQKKKKKSSFSFSHLIVEAYNIGERKELVVLAVFNNDKHPRIGTDLVINCWPLSLLSGQIADFIYQDGPSQPLFNPSEILKLVEALEKELDPFVLGVNKSAKICNRFPDLTLSHIMMEEFESYLNRRYSKISLK